MAEGSSRSPEFKANRITVLKRDAYTCVYCGREATEADHVIPVSKGGTDDVTNLVACCKSCNAGKGDRVATRLNWYDIEWLDSL